MKKRIVVGSASLASFALLLAYLISGKGNFPSNEQSPANMDTGGDVEISTGPNP